MGQQHYTRDWTYEIDERLVAEVRALAAAVAVFEVRVVRVAAASTVEELLPVAGDDAAAPVDAIGEEFVLEFPAIAAEVALVVAAAAGAGDIAAAAAAAADVMQQQFGWFYHSPSQDCYSLAVEDKRCFEQQPVWPASNKGYPGQHNSLQLGLVMQAQDFVGDRNPR